MWKTRIGITENHRKSPDPGLTQNMDASLRWHVPLGSDSSPTSMRCIRACSENGARPVDPGGVERACAVRFIGPHGASGRRERQASRTWSTRRGPWREESHHVPSGPRWPAAGRSGMHPLRAPARSARRAARSPPGSGRRAPPRAPSPRIPSTGPEARAAPGFSGTPSACAYPVVIVFTQNDGALIMQLAGPWPAARAKGVIRENLPASSSRKSLNASRAMSAIKFRFRDDMQAKRG